MKYPEKTTIWLSKTTRDRYRGFGMMGENFDKVLNRIADEYELQGKELIKLRKLKKGKK